jgi:hypothetical protein
MMEINEALEIKRALVVLGKALDLEPVQVASKVCFLDSNRFNILKEASELWNKFEDASLVERGAMMGMTIMECNKEESEKLHQEFEVETE